MNFTADALLRCGTGHATSQKAVSGPKPPAGMANRLVPPNPAAAALTIVRKALACIVRMQATLTSGMSIFSTLCASRGLWEHPPSLYKKS